MIRLEQASRVYRNGPNAVWALREVSLEVAEGEFVAVVGPSGSGKSTLLHLVGALERPSEGRVVTLDRYLGSMSESELARFRRRQIGFVFQFFNLLPTLTARENVGLPLLLDGKTWLEARQRSDEMLDRVGMGHRGDHTPDQLSGGELQRVAIARALVTHPPLLLADEPTGNLDSRTGGEILELLRLASSEKRQTVLMVTHDLHAAATANRVIRLRDGMVQEEVHPSALRETER